MSDMWVEPDLDPRQQDSQPRGERAVLVEYLERYRLTFEMKCEGLDAEQLAQRSVPPSTMSLLGLLRHLAAVEQTWFRRIVQGHHDLPRLWGKDERRDADFDDAIGDAALVAEAWSTWRHEVEHGRSVLAALSLDDLVSVHGDDVEVRDIVVHLIEEYARHCGHADLLRECVDGRIGQ